MFFFNSANLLGLPRFFGVVSLAFFGLPRALELAGRPRFLATFAFFTLVFFALAGFFFAAVFLATTFFPAFFLATLTLAAAFFFTGCD